MIYFVLLIVFAGCGQEKATANLREAPVVATQGALTQGVLSPELASMRAGVQRGLANKLTLLSPLKARNERLYRIVWSLPFEAVRRNRATGSATEQAQASVFLEVYASTVASEGLGHVSDLHALGMEACNLLRTMRGEDGSRKINSDVISSIVTPFIEDDVFQCIDHVSPSPP
jgi:hypothetical protein